MKKYFLMLALLMICGNAFGRLKEPITIEKPVEKTSDYWVYVRLEDRSGVTTEDDAGRSKAGDVVAVLPVSPQHIPSETEKKSYMIYKTSLTETQRNEMLEPWVEETTTKDGDVIEMPKAYRKNKLDTSKLGVEVKKGLVTKKIDATKIDYQVKTSDDLAMYELKRKFYAYVQRPAIRLANIITRKAFAETVSIINKTGEDYNTISLWEDDKDGDLVTDTRQETAEVYDDDGDLSAGCAIDGSTTNASYYMKITAPAGERHNGADGGVTLKNVSTASPRFYINDAYAIVEWMHIDGWGGIGYNNVAIQVAADGDYVTIRYNLVHDEVSGNVGRGISSSGYIPTPLYIYNNIVYNVYNGIVYDVGAGGERAYIYSNTVYGCSNIGILDKFNEALVINNISYNNGTDFDIGRSGSDYNFSKDDTSAVGSNYIRGDTDGKTPDFVSTTAGSEDFHLTSTSDAIDVGTSLSGTFTIDIDGDTRSGTWDIGADEYAGTPPQIF